MDKYANNNGLIVAKITSMAILSLCSFLLGILPLALTRKISSLNTPPSTSKSLVISLLLCFGGGVLLFTTFLHLQPEVREGFDRLEELGKIKPMPNGLPLSEIVLCGGFFFVYLIEELVHVFLIKKHHSAGNLKMQSIQNTLVADKNSSSSFNQSNNELVSHEGGSHMHLDFDTMKNSFSGLLAVLALSFHAVFEGLAVGLEGNTQKVWYLFAAIATHKFVIAFCMGVELVTSKTKMALVFVLMATFALVTPLGIGIGILLSEAGDADEGGADVTSVVLQGMAAGTLLYVVFFEVLARERNSGHGNGLWKLMAILAGFAVMLALQVATGHEHSHGESHADDERGHDHLETTTAAATAAIAAAASAATQHAIPADTFNHTY